MDNEFILTLSHSQKKTFLTCPRRWELKYSVGLTKKSQPVIKPLLLGSAFHAGIAEFIHAVYEGRSTNERKMRAREGVNQWVQENTVVNKTYNNNDGMVEVDHNYYKAMAEVQSEALKLVDYYAPRMGFGSKYMPVNITEIMAIDPDDIGHEHGLYNGPVVEWNFTQEVSTTQFVFGVNGIVDAIVRDMETGEIILMDFKLRGMFGQDNVASLDDQLYIYAALLDKMGIRIDKVCMYQIRSKLPSVASISEKSGLPNTGGERGFDTTEERWRETIPANVRVDQWLPKLAGKFKPVTDFIRPVFGIPTRDTHQMMLLNLIAVARMMYDAKARDSYPAVLASDVCKNCEFLNLCRAMQFGGNPQTIINMDYEQRKSKELEEDAEIE